MAERTPVFFLDANILMCALGKPHLYREPCLKVLGAVQADAIDVVTNVEMLQEILHRYRVVGSPDLAERVFTQARTLCEVVLPVRLRDVDLAATLLKRFPSIQVRDAIHAATMLHAGIRRILSTDRHFDAIKGIRRIDPIKFPRLSKGSR